MDHVADGFLVILAQVDDTGLGLSELGAAGAVEKGRPRAEDHAVDRPLLCLANNGQIGVFSAQLETSGQTLVEV